MKNIKFIITLFFFVVSNAQTSFSIPPVVVQSSNDLVSKKTDQNCQNRPLGPQAYNYNISGDNIVYHSPANKDANGWTVRQSAVTFSDKIFSLPFDDRDVKYFNGWLYERASWHYAVDYFVDNFDKSFEVHPAANGRVIFVGWDNWSGNTVVISHDAGGIKDAYRTIYMHLRNGPINDCNNSWEKSIPSIANQNENFNKFRNHLTVSGCTREAGNRKIQPLHWGTPEQKIRVGVGDVVTTNQIIGYSGNTGPRGQIAANNPSKPNLHLHIFFARRDQTNNNWYFFDPYGIYGARDCYPKKHHRPH